MKANYMIFVVIFSVFACYQTKKEQKYVLSPNPEVKRYIQILGPVKGTITFKRKNIAGIRIQAPFLDAGRAYPQQGSIGTIEEQEAVQVATYKALIPYKDAHMIIQPTVDKKCDKMNMFIYYEETCDITVSGFAGKLKDIEGKK